MCKIAKATKSLKKILKMHNCKITKRLDAGCKILTEEDKRPFIAENFQNPIHARLQKQQNHSRKF